MSSLHKNPTYITFMSSLDFATCFKVICFWGNLKTNFSLRALRLILRSENLCTTISSCITDKTSLFPSSYLVLIQFSG